jgi:hypothetical protein
MLIIAMLIQSSPSMTVETMNKWKAASRSLPAINEQANEVIMRGTEESSLALLTAQGIEFERRQDAANAEPAYRQAITLIEPINDSAWMYN